MRVIETEKGNALISGENFLTGQIVIDFWDSHVFKARSMYTVETRWGHAVDEKIKYINHSCEPNCYIDKTLMFVMAQKPILIGDEITFDYKENEQWIAHRFKCSCKSKLCRGWIK